MLVVAEAPWEQMARLRLLVLLEQLAIRVRAAPEVVVAEPL